LGAGDVDVLGDRLNGDLLLADVTSVAGVWWAHAELRGCRQHRAGLGELLIGGGDPLLDDHLLEGGLRLSFDVFQGRQDGSGIDRPVAGETLTTGTRAEGRLRGWTGQRRAGHRRRPAQTRLSRSPLVDLLHDGDLLLHGLRGERRG